MYLKMENSSNEFGVVTLGVACYLEIWAWFSEIVRRSDFLLDPPLPPVVAN